MDIAMKTRKLIIDGTHYDLSVFKEGDGSIRIEVIDSITLKPYKMFPDNKIIFEE